MGEGFLALLILALLLMLILTPFLAIIALMQTNQLGRRLRVLTGNAQESLVAIPDVVARRGTAVHVARLPRGAVGRHLARNRA